MWSKNTGNSLAMSTDDLSKVVGTGTVTEGEAKRDGQGSAKSSGDAGGSDGSAMNESCELMIFRADSDEFFFDSDSDDGSLVQRNETAWNRMSGGHEADVTIPARRAPQTTRATRNGSYIMRSSPRSAAPFGKRRQRDRRATAAAEGSSAGSASRSPSPVKTGASSPTVRRFPRSPSSPSLSSGIF